MISTDKELPTTQNCVFAIHLDMKKKTEKILIGELDEIKRYLSGYPCPMLFEQTRDIGHLVMDYVPAAGEFADTRVALMNSIGIKKSSLLENAVNTLNDYWRSDNPVYRFIAVLMWQEYRRAMRDPKSAERLFDTFDDITLALRFSLMKMVKNWQEQNRRNPLEYLDADFRKYPVTIHYSGGMDTDEYAITDRSLLSIAVYYLKRVYDSGRYIQTCPICGRSFVAKTVGMTTLCSDDCRRVQGKENKRRFDERAREISFERAYKNTYMYWYNKVVKFRKIHWPETKMEKIETAFKSFSKESARRKKQVVKDKSGAAEYEVWLLAQRNVIDELIEKLEV